jgi:porphobilinogen synthase
MPLFVRPGRNQRTPIPSLPGISQLSVDELVKECRAIAALGVPAVLLFGQAERKDEQASRAYAKSGLIQQAVSEIKSALPKLLVITDVCLCAYTSHGHCGVTLRGTSNGTVRINQQATLELLAKTAVSHADAGADMVAPSDMTDGNVGAIRRALDASGSEDVPILAYSVKFASSLYGPFRQAVDSAPQFGDRRGYQLDPANSEEAIREARLDIAEGADILMVKPALPYLDIILRLKQEFHHPVAAFNVSGEYAMIKAAAERGWVPEQPAWHEILTAIKRAGADIIITYWAKDAAAWLQAHG